MYRVDTHLNGVARGFDGIIGIEFEHIDASFWEIDRRHGVGGVLENCLCRAGEHPPLREERHAGWQSVIGCRTADHEGACVPQQLIGPCVHEGNLVVVLRISAGERGAPETVHLLAVQRPVVERHFIEYAAEPGRTRRSAGEIEVPLGQGRKGAEVRLGEESAVDIDRRDPGDFIVDKGEMTEGCLA